MDIQVVFSNTHWVDHSCMLLFKHVFVSRLDALIYIDMGREMDSGTYYLLLPISQLIAVAVGSDTTVVNTGLEHWSATDLVETG